MINLVHNSLPTSGVMAHGNYRLFLISVFDVMVVRTVLLKVTAESELFCSVNFPLANYLVGC